MSVIYLNTESGWKQYDLNTDELEEAEPPLPTNDDIVFSKEVEEELFSYIKEI